jgi:hypothetical protein
LGLSAHARKNSGGLSLVNSRSPISKFPRGYYQQLNSIHGGILVLLVAVLTKVRGLNPLPLGRLFRGWGLNLHPQNLAINDRLSTIPQGGGYANDYLNIFSDR